MSSFYAQGSKAWASTDVATTTYAITGLGFTPKALKFYWMGLNSAVNAASSTTDIRQGIGFATSTSDRRCVGTNEVDAAATMTCTGIYRNDAVAALCKATGPAADGLLDLNSLDVDGFTLIVDAQAGASVMVFWEAWGGTDITVASTVEISEPAATGNQTYTVTGFSSTDSQDQVVMFSGTNLTAANTVARTDAVRMFGVTTGTAAAENRLMTANSQDNQTATACTRWGGKTNCIGIIGFIGPALTSKANLNAFATDGFTLNWTTRTTTNRKYIALAIKGGKWQAGGFDLDIGTLNATSVVTGLGWTPGNISLFTVWSPEQTVNGDFAHFFSLGSVKSTSSRQGMTETLTQSAADDDVKLAIVYDCGLGFTDGSTITYKVDITVISSDGFTAKTILTPGTPFTEHFNYLAFETNTNIAVTGGGVRLRLHRKNFGF